MNYGSLQKQYIESLNSALDGYYRDLDYYERIGHQTRVDELEALIDSLKKQIEEAV
jgi:hypothetical protein